MSNGNSDLIAGLQALGRQEREREEMKQTVREMYERSYKDSHHQGWAADLMERYGKRTEAEAERQEFMRKCEEGEV